MAKPQMKRTEDLPDVPTNEDYAPRTYTAREHAVMGVKVVLFVGLLLGLLWLLDAIAAK